MTSSTDSSSIFMRNVEEEMKESYLRYSMSVIISRALPDVRDGLKPSQRRILYAMRQLNLSPGAKHRKCAKICGDTSGDYHPHGEQVIYPTLVRMAQGWAMRYPLVDGQGNFGSVDGDPPAAMRYTEARMTHSAVQLMEDLDKETVDFIPNYDETKEEPTVFPAKFPALLSVGSSGIAVGMATNIPPHHIGELIDATLLVLNDRQVAIQEILKVMPGPDFPTGGLICGTSGIREAYETGRGKLTLRAVIRVEDVDKSGDKQRLIVDELPYNVNKARLIEHIADLINDKQLPGISDLRDDSDKNGLRITIDLKRGTLPDVVINQLYKFTEMQVTFGCIMLALDKGLPRTMNIRQMIGAWIDHRREVIRRRTRFELNKAEARAHVLEGYLKAVNILDEVVALIRASQNREEAKEKLMQRYAFTERQAMAILELRLYQLTGLEQDKIQEEHRQLLEKIAHYRAILGSEEMVKEIIRDELQDIKKHYKDPRRSQIVPMEGEMAMEDLIADEQTVITISEDDYIKRMPVAMFREQRRGGQGVAGMQMKREDDVLKGVFVASTHSTLLIFTNLGRCYWLKVWQIPDTGRRSKGKPLINLLENLQPEEKIATILQVRGFDEPNTCILQATKQGVIKKTDLSAFSNPRKSGVIAITIDEKDELIKAALVQPGQQVMLFTRHGMAVRFDESEARSIGRTAHGVRGVTLRAEDDCVVGCEVVKGDETILTVCDNGYGKRTQVEEFRQTHRGGVGVRSIITSERNGLVVGALAVTDADSLLIMSKLGQTLRISVSQMRILGRATQGVRLVNLKDEKDILLAVQKVEAQEGEEPAEDQTPLDSAQKGEMTAESTEESPAS